MAAVPGIRVLYVDDDIVVVDKPCDLRAVPGHANPPPDEVRGDRIDGGGGTGKQSNRMTAQEAWVKAIQSMSSKEPDAINIATDDRHEIDTYEKTIEEAAIELINNLGTTANPSCVPRKSETFVTYCYRNRKRLLPSFPELQKMHEVASTNEHNDEPKPKKPKCFRSPGQCKSSIPALARTIFERSFSIIRQKQRPLMNLPKPTDDRESAIGQLCLLGFGDPSHCAYVDKNFSNTTPREEVSHQSFDSNLYVVHRLDCQTSGVMVVARNRGSASFLCRAWRERESVQKIYHAHVKHWPPYHQKRLREGMIDIPLAPSRTERIKWEVRPVAEGGKECKTFWKVHEDFTHDVDEGKDKTDVDEDGVAASLPEQRGIVLELHPITGRTHQLRLHCAAIGSGIVGDSLYGDTPISCVWNPNLNSCQDSDEPSSLRLHAHKLAFPKPKNGERIMFESPTPWIDLLSRGASVAGNRTSS
ncbi:hypothetical protein ACHAWF_013662 [Thalassiosira exigua]